MATKMLAQSRGLSDGSIDVQSVEFVVQSCGEELSEEEWDSVMRTCDHSTKGKFDIVKILKTYADLAVKVGAMEAQANTFVEEYAKNKKNRIAARTKTRIVPQDYGKKKEEEEEESLLKK
jgi:hypothetical protein